METPIVPRMNFFLTGFTESRAVGTVHITLSTLSTVTSIWTRTNASYVLTGHVGNCHTKVYSSSYNIPHFPTARTQAQ